MEFNRGGEVFSDLGEKIGTLDRVVLDPDTQDVTHIVVKKGLLITTDKLIPVSLIEESVKDKIRLSRNAEDLELFPDFEVTHFIPIHSEDREQQEKSLFWYPPLLAWKQSGGYLGYPMPTYVERKVQNIAPDLVALEEGAKVISKDGKHVGDIESIQTDPEIQRATHIVVTSGLLFRERRLIPTTWLMAVSEDEVQLSVSSDLLERLPEYDVES